MAYIWKLNAYISRHAEVEEFINRTFKVGDAWAPGVDCDGKDDDVRVIVTAPKRQQELLRNQLAMGDSSYAKLFTLIYDVVRKSDGEYGLLAASMRKAATCFNNEIVASKSLLKTEKSPIVRRRLTKISKLPRIELPEDTPYGGYPKLTYQDSMKLIKPLSGAGLKKHHKDYPANGRTVLYPQSKSLQLFAGKAIVNPLKPTPNLLAREHLVSHGLKDPETFMMSDPCYAVTASRLQQYNLFAVPLEEPTKRNTTGWMSILKEYGYGPLESVINDRNPVKYNPQATCWGCTIIDGVDLRAGRPYSEVGVQAHKEYLAWLDGDLSANEMDFISHTWNHLLVKPKIEVLSVETGSDLNLPDLDLELHKLYPKLTRTFGTGQNVSRTYKSILLTQYYDARKIDQHARREKGLPAPSISGITWNKAGILEAITYLIHGISKPDLSLKEALDFVATCADRKRMEMTVGTAARFMLWFVISASMSKGCNKDKFNNWLLTKEQSSRRIIYGPGAFHLLMNGPAVVSGEPPTFAIDDLDNLLALHGLYKVLKHRIEKNEKLKHLVREIRFILGGDDGMIRHPPELHSYLLEAVKDIKDTKGIIWTDLEMRQLLIINLQVLEEFLQGKVVQDMRGKDVDMYSGFSSYATIYGMVPVLVYDTEGETPFLSHAFPLYNIRKILCSFWQPAENPKGISPDQYASVRAYGMNMVIGMFHFPNAIFTDWVKRHPLPEKFEIPSEFNDENLKIDWEDPLMLCSKDVLDHWTQTVVSRPVAEEGQNKWLSFMNLNWADEVEDEQKETIKKKGYRESSYEDAEKSRTESLQVSDLSKAVQRFWDDEAQNYREELWVPFVKHENEKLQSLLNYSEKDIFKKVSNLLLNDNNHMTLSCKLDGEDWVCELGEWVISLPSKEWKKKRPPVITVLGDKPIVVGFPNKALEYEYFPEEKQHNIGEKVEKKRAPLLRESFAKHQKHKRMGKKQKSRAVEKEKSLKKRGKEQSAYYSDDSSSEWYSGSE